MSFPTRAQWFVAIHKGFRRGGTNCRPSTIYLIRIANRDNSYPPLPADLLDYRYFIGGVEADRKNADREFFEFMLEVIGERGWRIVRPFARRRALKYYEAVRSRGHRFFRYRGNLL